jgi:hypothetical protein
MKTKILVTIIVLSFVSCHSSFAQGSLTPPGAPAATMKTLAQIEPRTPIASGPFTITTPGSYYLTTNVTVSAGTAITVSANNVRLDLNGFTISSTENPATTGYGILLNAVTNITIVRGFISGGVTNNGGTYSGSGFGYGIFWTGSAPVNARISDVSISGCRVYGIHLGNNNSVVESCTVNTAGFYGILAGSVFDSTAQNCGNIGVVALFIADNSYGSASGGGTGLQAYTANNCYGVSVSSYGISATVATGCYGESDSGSADGIYAATANNCTGYSYGSGDGVYASNIATGCFGSSSTGTGLYAFNAAFCTGTRSGGTAIQAVIANGCIAFSGTNIVTYKYNMP